MKPIMLISHIALLSLFLVACHEKIESEANDQTFYVSVDGNDQDAGTIEQPLRTLEAAAEKAVAGTTVFIREGTYSEPLIVEHNGEPERPITFQAFEDEVVRLTGEQLADAEEDTALVHIQGKSYITIEGLEIESLSTNLIDETVMGIYVTGPSSHVLIKNNHIHDIGTYAEGGNAHGIAVYGDEPITDLTVSENTIENLTLGLSEALVLNGDVSHFSILNNVVRHTDNIGIDVIGHEGTAINPKDDFARDGDICYNEVHHHSSYSNISYDSDYSAGGIYVDGGQNITICENTVYANDIGIEATSEHGGQSASSIVIADNLVYENHYTGISIGGYDSERGGTNDSVISGNTLSGNDTVGLDGGQLLVQHHTFNNEIANNTLVLSESELFISNELSENDGNVLHHNLYRRAEDEQGRWTWKGQEANSLAEFQALSGSDRDSKMAF